MNSLLKRSPLSSAELTGYIRKTLNINDRNKVADKSCTLKQWFAVGAHSCKLRKTGSAHSYLMISVTFAWILYEYPQKLSLRPRT